MIIRLFIALHLLIPGAAAAIPPQPAEFKLIDLTEKFALFHSASAGQEDADRVRAFKDRFSVLLPDFYRSNNKAFDAQYDARILKALNAFPERQAGIQEVSRRFAASFAPARRAFEAAFEPIEDLPPVYLLHSLGQMDGRVQAVNGRIHLLFGGDMITEIHAGEDVTPLFHHELFHLYQKAKGGTCEQGLWCGLWGEGLAVYVASQLNPQATDSELLLVNPEFFPGGKIVLRDAIESNKQEAVCTALARFSSKDGKDFNAFFSGGVLNDRLPPRLGYYVGYLAAREAGRARSLRQLAEMKPPEIKSVVEAALRQFATCPAEGA